MRYALEMWVYPQVVTDTSFILRTDTTTDTLTRVSHLLGIMDGHFVHGVYDGAFKVVTSTVEVTPDTWYHVVGTAESNGDIKLYINGALEGGWMASHAVGRVRCYRLARLTVSRDRFFTIPRADEAAVYTRTLSAAEVTIIICCGPCGSASRCVLVLTRLLRRTFVIRWDGSYGLLRTDYSAWLARLSQLRFHGNSAANRYFSIVQSSKPIR